MLEFLVDNIFVVFAGKVFQQIIGIPMCTYCAPLLADIFMYSYEAEFTQSLLSTSRKRLASQFNFTYRYIDDVLSQLVSPLICRGPWMSTVVLYCWCHSDSASVLLYFTLITLTLKIISLRCIPLNLRSKTLRRSTLLLPTWIYSCQSERTVKFTLPFTTSVTILYPYYKLSVPEQ